MPRQLNRLTDLKIKNLTEPRPYPDGGGLYLQVSIYGTKSFVFRYERHGKRHSVGLGAYKTTTTLVQARESALKMRQQLQQGIDPLSQKNADKAAEQLRAARTKTFDQCFAEYFAGKKHEWSNTKHAMQVRNTVETYASPKIGNLSIADVDMNLVLSILEPIWTTKTETATRVRQRIEATLDWATAKGYRTGDNPARWKGHLDKVLPSAKKTKKVEHHPALPFAKLPAFIATLREREGDSALALEFCILTATRTSEVIKATWAEIDFGNATWVIPANRMKARQDHKVPLSNRCLEILKEMKRRNEAHVFPGKKQDKPLSNMAMLQLLERMGFTDITVHGFRSTFRDWCAESTDYPNHVIEMALAHTIGNAVEAAYRRGDLFEKRKLLMQEWADYCGKPT